MQHLPFLVVHGALVWKIVVALTGLGGVALIRRRARVREQRFVARSLSLYADASSAPLEGVVVLRGHLRGGTVTTHTGLERRGGPLAHRKDDGVWLDVGGDRVDIPGDAAVIRGTSARASWFGERFGAQRWFSLAAGDEVVALGTCEPRGAAEETYRDATRGWVLAPLPHRVAVEMLAARPAIVPRALGPVRAGFTLVGFALAMYMGLALMSPILVSINRSGLGAATPAGRDKALYQLEEEAARSSDPVTRETTYDLVELRAGCAAAFERMFEDGLLERALDTAQRCDLADGEARVMVQLGRYTEAAPIGDGNDELLADIGAGRWSAAVATYRASSTRGACTLELLHYRAGDDPNASANLEALASTDPVCATYAHHATVPTVLAVHDARVELEGGPAALLDVEPSPDSPAAALLAVYRGDIDTARRIADNLVHDSQDPIEALRFARLVELRSGHARDTTGLPTELDAAYTKTLRVISFEDLFRGIANVDRATLQQLVPAAHAMTFHPAHGPDVPGAMIREAALHRDIARYLGDAEHVTFWQHVIDRHLAMLADPDRRNLIAARFGTD